MPGAYYSPRKKPLRRRDAYGLPLPQRTRVSSPKEVHVHILCIIAIVGGPGQMTSENTTNTLLVSHTGTYFRVGEHDAQDSNLLEPGLR